MPADPAIEAALKVWLPDAHINDDDRSEMSRAIAAWLEAKAAEIFVPANEAEKHILPWLRTSAQALREGDGK